MKSTPQQLAARGFVSEQTRNQIGPCSEADIIRRLQSSVAGERTLGAALAAHAHHVKLLPLLCCALEKETKLYTKVALCEAIAAFAEKALPLLIPLLGKIGKNQHQTIKLVDLKKISFPLPRDIAARVIIRSGEVALPYLEEVMQTGTYQQKREAVDAIGHIAYTTRNFRSEKCLRALLQREQDEVLTWKVIRAFQAFPSAWVKKFLEKIISTSQDKVLVEEAKRSQRQIEKRRS